MADKMPTVRRTKTTLPGGCALYDGRVWHKRYTPAVHAFNYSLYMVLVDLDRVEVEFRGLWPLVSTSWWACARFLERDHLKDIPLKPGQEGATLADRVRDLVHARTGQRPEGSIQLLTNLEYYGYCFNPVSFYYCHDKEGKLMSVVSEVSNTPWEEMHCYVLHPDSKDVDNSRMVHSAKAPYTNRYLFKKDFHVSPFMDMHHSYDFSFHSPGNTLQVNTSMFKEDKRWFSATLKLRRREWRWWNMLMLLVYFPWMTIYIQVLIHWEAVRIWRKGVPFHPHPEGTQTWASVIIGAMMTPLFMLRSYFDSGEEVGNEKAKGICPGMVRHETSNADSAG
ncbi:hypothetical protein AAMO2058_000148800 [Amorphochlora amoebiformis]